MGNINFARVLLGGLVAGLILNIGEVLLNDMVLKAQMETFFTEHKFAPPGTNFMIVAVGLTLVMGFVIVFSYAAIRPRFGAGVKTAVIAGLFAWFGVYCYSGTINGMVFGMPMSAMMMVCAWGLVQYILAA